LAFGIGCAIDIVVVERRDLSRGEIFEVQVEVKLTVEMTLYY
jgi:hypothetical protein